VETKHSSCLWIAIFKGQRDSANAAQRNGGGDNAQTPYHCNKPSLSGHDWRLTCMGGMGMRSKGCQWQYQYHLDKPY